MVLGWRLARVINFPGREAIVGWAFADVAEALPAVGISPLRVSARELLAPSAERSKKAYRMKTTRSRFYNASRDQIS